MSSEEGAAAKASGGGAVRVRFLSHDGGPGGGLKPLDGRSTLEIGEYGHHCERLSQSGSWATLTQSERDLSEVHRADSESRPLRVCYSLLCCRSVRRGRTAGKTLHGIRDE